MNKWSNMKYTYDTYSPQMHLKKHLEKIAVHYSSLTRQLGENVSIHVFKTVSTEGQLGELGCLSKQVLGQPLQLVVPQVELLEVGQALQSG